METAAIDDLDRAILDELRIDGRISWRELGERVGLGATATADRVRRLTDAGVITRFTTVIDPAARGSGLRAIVDLRLGAGTHPDEFGRWSSHSAEVQGIGKECEADGGENRVLEGVNLLVWHGGRVGLVGPNGAGKSTLLRILSGEMAADSGSMTIHKGVKVALHDQRPPRDSGLTLEDYLYSGRADTIETEKELEALEQRMSDGDHGEETMRRYTSAQQRLELAGGYRWRDEVVSVLRGLGFDDSQLTRQLDTFSGGELTRASLARALAAGYLGQGTEPL